MAGIDKTAVLDRLDFRVFYSDYLDLSRTRGEEVNVHCPFHEDKQPSMSLDLKTGLFCCHGCGAGGSVFDFLMRKENLSFSEAFKRLAQRVGLMGSGPPIAAQPKPAPKKAEAKPVDPAVVDQYRKALLSMPAKLNWLTSVRGLTHETIEIYELGYCAERGRYSLPIKNADGTIPNVRFYKPNPPEGEPKMESWAAGYGTSRLYPTNDVQGEEVLICEGELDCLLARQFGFNAYTVTNGADAFTPAHAQHFRGKDVLLCYDVDKAGKEGATKTARLIAPLAKSVRIINLPIKEPENADLTDYFVFHKRSAADLAALIEAAPEFRDGRTRPGKRDFQGLVPRGSLIEAYVTMGTETTDCPPEFHLAVCLSVMSAVLGNSVWFHAYGDDIFCNLWTLILAPSGFYRKTTAMKIGLRLLRQNCPKHILPNDFTKERLVDALREQPAGIVPVFEFGSLLQQMNKDYNAGTKELVTELYDATEYRRETKQGAQKIERPALSILAASTIDWLVERITAGDMRSGFLARFLYWPAREKHSWRGFGAQEEHALVSTLKYSLSGLAEVQGKITFPEPVLATYNHWLESHEGEVNTQRLPDELQGFYTRLSVYALKFAVLYEMSGSQALMISPESMAHATRLAEYLKYHLVRLVEDEIVTTTEGRDLKRIKDIIRREPGCDKSRILRLSKITARRLDPLLETVLQSHEVIAEKQHVGSKTKIVYRLEESEVEEKDGE